MEDNNNSDNKPWGGKRTLPYTLVCTVNSRLGLTSTLMTKNEKKEEKDACACPGWAVSTYVGYVHVRQSV
jgi:hypothetical protein